MGGRGHLRFGGLPVVQSTKNMNQVYLITSLSVHWSERRLTVSLNNHFIDFTVQS